MLLAQNKGTFKLCDFGSATTQSWIPGKDAPIALLEEEIEKFTTLQYRAPEMVDLYMGHTINTKSDIWVSATCGVHVDVIPSTRRLAASSTRFASSRMHLKGLSLAY